MQTPKLRFKADDGSDFPAFESKSLSDVCKYRNKQNVGKNYVGTENMKQNFSGIELLDDKKEIKGICYYKGDILMSNIRPYLKKTWKADRDGVCSTDVLVFCPLCISNEYLYYVISSDKFVSYVMTGAKGVKMPRGDKGHMMEFSIMVPSLPEQQKIADFLSTIDTVIEKQQVTVKAWEQRKKGVMQKLFNQEVRFKADDGSDFPDWEEKTLGNIFVERIERSVGGEELLSVTIAQGVIRQSDSDKRNNSSENKSNYKVVKKNDLAYNTMRMWQGAEGVSEYDGIVSPAYTIVTPKAGNNVKYFEIFFKQLSMLHLFQRYSQGLTSDTWNLKFPAFAKIKCQVPCEKEQDKIVNCISYLDDVIKKQKEILEKWQELKKGLLQQMFV